MPIHGEMLSPFGRLIPASRLLSEHKSASYVRRRLNLQRNDALRAHCFGALITKLAMIAGTGIPGISRPL
jgi:hypothetical protein